MDLERFTPRSTSIPLLDPSQVGEARRATALLASDQNLSAELAGRAAIIATEMANNVVSHAGTGELLLRALEQNGVAGLEIIAVDRGPGMEDISKCLRDGYSTGGTQGTGLGSIRRLAHFFDIWSAPQLGTLIMARLWSHSPPAAAFEYGVICVPIHGEPCCGDSWAVKLGDSMVSVLMVDGLGHGDAAAAAADRAVEIFFSAREDSPSAYLSLAQTALKATRGAAAALIHIDAASGNARFAGLGNISGSLQNAESVRHLVSMNGTVGGELRRVQEFTAPWLPNDLLILHSDGLTSRWDLKKFPGLSARHPSLIAAALYRDFKRGRDDASVFVLRAIV